MGRTWSSPPGNIFATALYREPGGVPIALRAGFAAALAVCDTITSYDPDELPRLKWPNDVRIAGQKISGILLETGSDALGVWVAAGIGLNVCVAPEGTGQPVTCLETHLPAQRRPTATEVFERLREAFAERLACSRTNFADLRRAWTDRAEGLGQLVQVKLANETIRGVFVGIDERGAMLLRLPDGGLRPILAGDVVLSRTD